MGRLVYVREVCRALQGLPNGLSHVLTDLRTVNPNLVSPVALLVGISAAVVVAAAVSVVVTAVELVEDSSTCPMFVAPLLLPWM